MGQEGNRSGHRVTSLFSPPAWFHRIAVTGTVQFPGYGKYLDLEELSCLILFEA